MNAVKFSDVINVMCVKCWQALKSSSLPKKKKVHITPAQQMLNRFEVLQKSASSSNSAAVKRSSSIDGSVAVKVGNITTAHDHTKPILGHRVAHKPTLVRM